MMARIWFLFAAVLSLTSAFAPPKSAVSSTAVLRPSLIIRPMSEEPEDKPVISKDGTYFDDEVEPAQKAGISDSMKERLRREASSGLDSEQKQTNVILYIMLGVVVLVILGGQGILY